MEQKEKYEDIVIKGLCRVLDNQKEIVEEIDRLHKLIQEIKRIAVATNREQQFCGGRVTTRARGEQNGCRIFENENG
ncbi:MAG: hypothetical protein AB1349_01695 [Elusimicrobiota bacterium]